jgi:transposase-like protein
MSGSLNELYQILGVSKQAVHQYQKRQLIFDKRCADLLVEVDELRAAHPGCGVEKMYYTLKPQFIGRDRFIEMFMELGYRIQHIKNYHRTTIPTAFKYPNLIEGMIVKNKNTVWQSDITYFDIKGKFYYMVFIIDVYTRQIVGYAVSEHLRAEANLKALKMAVKKHGIPKIHHSDRGSQYIEKQYTQLLKDNGVAISMGLQAQDNAYAERINGTIKNDYLKHWEIQTFECLKSKVTKAIKHYNSKRIHNSLPKRESPDVFAKFAGNYGVVEEIYASKRVIPATERSFCGWNDETKENDLFCIIN